MRRAAGRSYPDLIRLRTGKLELAPDAVARARPRPSRSPALLAACAEAGVAVVPFGGGSSVVGGLDAVAGAHSAVLSLDLAGLRSVEIDRTSLTARLGPGLRGPEAEAALGELGATLGHFPQSYEQAHDRRLRGHPLGRPGLDRLRALRRAGHRGRADRARRARCARCEIPHTRRRARRCASWCWARRGRSA